MQAVEGVEGSWGGRGARAQALGRVERTVRRCLVCGSREVRTDAVEQRGWVLLAECPHCDHRWTQSLPQLEPAPTRAVLSVAPGTRSAPEVVSAA